MGILKVVKKCTRTIFLVGKRIIYNIEFRESFSVFWVQTKKLNFFSEKDNIFVFLYKIYFG